MPGRAADGRRLGCLTITRSQQSADLLRQSSSGTAGPGLSRLGGLLELPAFAAMAEEGLSGEVVRLSSGTIRSNSKTPPRPSWTTRTSLSPLDGSTEPRWIAWSVALARRPRLAELSGPKGQLVPQPLRRGADDLEPGAAHRPSRSRLVAPGRPVHRRPYGRAKRRGRIDCTRILTRGQLERLFTRRDPRLREGTPSAGCCMRPPPAPTSF